MPIRPHFSLIFVNFRSIWPLSLALESLYAREREKDSFEVIVVNNDPTEAVVLEGLAKHLGFRLVQSKENAGFGRGSNQGACLAQGEILGFINPDTLWETPILDGIAKKFQLVDGIMGLTILDSLGGRERWAGGRFPTLGHTVLRKITPFFSNESSERFDWVSGSALFLSRNHFSALGGFDEDFFLYFEDVDLCFRATAKAIPVCQADEPIRHLGGKSFSSTSFQKECYSSSQRHYFFKHRPRWEGVALRVLQGLFYQR